MTQLLAESLRALQEMVRGGHIYRGRHLACVALYSALSFQFGYFSMKPTRSLNVDRKPVYWSPSTRTALAEAELEYPEASQALTFEHKKHMFSQDLNFQHRSCRTMSLRQSTWPSSALSLVLNTRSVCDVGYGSLPGSATDLLNDDCFGCHPAAFRLPEDFATFKDLEVGLKCCE